MSDSHIAPRLEVAHDRVCGREVHDALASTQVLGLITSLRVRMGDDLMTEVTGASSSAIEEWCDGWLELPPDAEARLRLVDPIYPQGQSAVKPGDSVTLRLLATDAYGIADDLGHFGAQAAKAPIQMIKSAVDFVEPAIDLVEPLLRFRLKCEQVLMHAFDLLRQESERAFDLAHAALQIANLGFDVHAHVGSLA